MTTPGTSDEALALVHRGWEHRRLQRPLAAWACWQRALRLSPGDPAATEALDRLAQADDLPAAARATYRFHPPRGEERRSCWDERLRERDMSDLRVAAATFGELADADAHYNQALCLAWLGENAGAIAALDRVVAMEAAESPESAVEAWTLAEVLRQGAGAEHLCDDPSHTLVIAWPDDLGDPIEWLSLFAVLKEMPPPIDPVTRQPVVPGARVFEWLDRPMPNPSSVLTADDLPRVRAGVIVTPGELRLSSPVAKQLEGVERDLGNALGGREIALVRRSTPLPFALMDSATWRFRLPEGSDETTRQGLTREAVEHYFENEWIFTPRFGLGSLYGESDPAEPPRVAELILADEYRFPVSRPLARAKLSAVVNFREQLAARPRVAALYCGYPFDRLRRRLGLAMVDPSSVDPTDYSCMSAAEIERLDLSSLDVAALTEVYRSARVVADTATAGRVATALAERDPSALVRVDPPRLLDWVASSVHKLEGPERALAWVDRALALDEAEGDRHRGRFELLRARILDQAGRRSEAIEQNRSILDRFPDDVELGMDAAERLLDEVDGAVLIPLLERLVERARRSGDRVNEGIARWWLDELQQ